LNHRLRAAPSFVFRAAITLHSFVCPSWRLLPFGT
jgi:predicted deacetylase